MNAFWIILTGWLVAASCGLLGCFLILKRMSMIGDAISHAVLPGIAISYLLVHGKNPVLIVVSSAFFCLLTTFLIEYFTRKAKLQSDASIGVTFTALFALGVMLISVYAKDLDIDQDCVLYGEIASVPLEEDFMLFGYILGPWPVWQVLFVFLIVLFCIIIFYKPLFLTTFDPSYAASIGVMVGLWHYVLMTLVSLTTVVAFDAVGAVLVVALLITTPATAYLLTDKLKKMLLYSVLLGGLSAAGGYYIAKYLDASVAGGISVMAGLLFLVVFLFAPRYGFLVKRRKASHTFAAKRLKVVAKLKKY